MELKVTPLVVFLLGVGVGVIIAVMYTLLTGNEFSWYGCAQPDLMRTDPSELPETCTIDENRVVKCGPQGQLSEDRLAGSWSIHQVDGRTVTVQLEIPNAQEILWNEMVDTTRSDTVLQIRKLHIDYKQTTAAGAYEVVVYGDIPYVTKTLKLSLSGDDMLNIWDDDTKLLGRALRLKGKSVQDSGYNEDAMSWWNSVTV